jgi:hypothetical protein
MKPLKMLGLLVAILGMCAVFSYAGTVLSHWGDPVQAEKQAATKSKVQKAPSSVQSAAVATAQESTDLTQ